MSKKEIAVMSLIVALFVGLMSGLIAFSFQRQAQFAEESKKECAKVATLSNADDSHYENGICYLIKGNKLERVDL
jgi:hypothetical protein